MASNIISLDIPLIPTGKGRPRFRRFGDFVSTYTPKKTKDHEEAIKALTVESVGSPKLSGPVVLDLWCYMPIPKSWSKKKTQQAIEREIYPTGKPDIDNLLKIIGDALNDVIWLDDKQIVVANTHKIYSTNPRYSLKVTPLSTQETLST